MHTTPVKVTSVNWLLGMSLQWMGQKVLVPSILCVVGSTVGLFGEEPIP